jgi:hypothetical protein
MMIKKLLYTLGIVLGLCTSASGQLSGLLAPPTTSAVGDCATTELCFNNAGTMDGSLLTTDGTNVELTSGQMLLAPGTESLPTLAMAADPDTGWYTGGGGGWQFTANGSNKIRITGSTIDRFDNINFNSTAGNIGFGQGTTNIKWLSTNALLTSRGTEGAHAWHVRDDDDGTNYEGVSIGTDSAGTVTIAAESGGTGCSSGAGCDISIPLLGTGNLGIASSLEGGTGNVHQFWARATLTLTGASTDSVLSPAIASGDRIGSCQFNVNTAVVTSSATNTWDALFKTGSTTTLCAAGQAGAQNTKCNASIAFEIQTDVSQIVFDAPGAETFSSGAIEMQCLVERMTSMANA